MGETHRITIDQSSVECYLSGLIKSNNSGEIA